MEQKASLFTLLINNDTLSGIVSGRVETPYAGLVAVTYFGVSQAFPSVLMLFGIMSQS